MAGKRAKPLAHPFDVTDSRHAGRFPIARRGQAVTICEPFCGLDVAKSFCTRRDDGRLAVIIGIGPLGRDLIRDVFGIVPDSPKEGRSAP